MLTSISAELFDGIAFLLAAVVLQALAILLLLLREPGVPGTERFLRWKNGGTALALLAMAWCVPQIRAVAWAWLVPWLWPLVLAATAACWFALDHLMARALAGLMILGAYHFLRESFALTLPLLLPGAILSWLLGIMGICIAAKPYWLRDLLRSAARRNWVKAVLVGFLELCAVYLIAVTILLWSR